MQHTKHDQPLGLLGTVLVRLRIAERLPVGVTGFIDLLLGAVTDENGLATPLDNNLFNRQTQWSEILSSNGKKRAARRKTMFGAGKPGGNVHSCPPGWMQGQPQP